MSERVPRIPRALIAALISRADRLLVLRDLDARFAEISTRKGTAAARRWYWSQALRGMPALLSFDVAAVQSRTWHGTTGDMRYGIRSLRRRPLYGVGVIGTLTLGLCSAASVFAVAWQVWLAPMPFPDPGRVVRLYELMSSEDVSFAGQTRPDAQRWRLSPPLLEDLREHDWSTVTAVAGVSTDNLDWTRDGETSLVSSLQASPEIFSILGIVPILGRSLSEDDALQEVVLSRALWSSAFGEDPEVAEGRTMVLDGRVHRIVGVVELPAGYPRSTDIITRMSFDEDDLREGMRGARYLDAIARVSASSTVSDASAEMDRFVRSLGESFPAHGKSGGEAVALGDDLIRPYRSVLALLLLAGASFLALAVVNVTGLVAARQVEGSEDRSVRLAFGASEGRLLRQSVVEGLLVGAMGSAAALLGTHWLLAPIRTLVPRGVPRLSSVGLDLTVAAALVAAGLIAGLVVGVMGYGLARRAARGSRSTRGSSSPGLGGRRLLVVGQVALTTLLLTGGFAILRHVMGLKAVDNGFEPSGVLVSAAVLSQAQYPDKAIQGSTWRAVEEGLASRGFEAAIAVNPPMSGSTMPFGYRLDKASDQSFAQYHTVTAGYFELMGIDLVDGRLFSATDDEASARVVVINERVAREQFPRESAVGRQLTLVNTPRTVVGVVRSTRHFGPDEEAQEEMYVPLGQDPWLLGHVLIKTGRTDAQAALESVLGSIDPSLVFPPLEPYSGYLSDWYASFTLQLIIVGVLALVGLSLAALGLYAMVAYHVTSRSREIGIRMALGAPGGRLFSTVVAQGVVTSAMGLAAGLGIWYAAAPRIRVFMVGMDTADSWTPALAVALVGGMSVLATLAPAWRSTAVDPSVTLRAE